MRWLLLPVALTAACSEYEIQAEKPDVGTDPTEPVEDAPWLQIDPETYGFPTACADAVEVTLSNVGDAPLTITALDYSGSTDLTLDSTLALPLTLEVGEEAGVFVRYAPGTGTDAYGLLSVTSNDPRGVVEAQQAAQTVMSEVTEHWTVEADPPIDVVFAIDKSGSMTEEMNNLATAFDDFITEVGLVTVDWRIGVVSKDDGCFNNGIILPTTPAYEDVFNDAVRGLQMFQTDLTEALLELTSVALHQTGANGCNAGFARSDAVLHVIAVSDEPEQSGQPWDHWVTEYRAAKPDPDLVIVSSVVDVNNDCGSGADQYLQASADTGGLVLNVCNSVWGTFAADLGNASAAALRTFYLSAEPDPATIEVKVDGVAYAAGWHYDATRVAVVADVDLPVGADVAISYTAIGCE